MGKGTSGFSFVNTGSSQYNNCSSGTAGSRFTGSAVLAVNSTGRQDIQVTWTGGTVTVGDGSPTPRQCRIQLQYRIGTTGNFTSVSGAEYISTTAGNSSTVGPYTLPSSCDDQPIVQIRWVYYLSAVNNGGTRPELRVDDITVSSTPISAASITTSTISGSPFCAGSGLTASVSVPFTISGTFNSGNMFTAQLSAANGSFASPTNIGTITQTTAGTISATIPAATPAGTGYRIRVIGSNPATTGSINGADLTVQSFAGPTSVTSICGNADATVSWTNPQCFDEVMLVAKASNFTTALPTGNGSAYTANLTFGSGTAFDGGTVVYKGTATASGTIVGLTNGTEYRFKAFARRGTTWVAAAVHTCTPSNTCGTENFTNLPTGSPTNYLSRSWTGTNSVTWTAEGARTDQTLTGKAICFGTSGNRWVTSPTYANGMGQLSFSYVRGFTNTDTRTLQVWVNGTQIGGNITVSPNSNTVQNYNETINISGSVQLEIRSISAGQVIVDDLTWSCYSLACATPTVHSSSLSSGSVTTTTAQLSWTSGNGGSRIVVVRQGGAVNANPANNSTYSANAAFGSGSQIGTGNYVVYKGIGNSVTVTGLTPGREYFVKVFEFGCDPGSEDYLTSGTPANTNFIATPSTPTSFASPCVAETSIDLTWAAPTGHFDGYLLVARPNATEPSVAGLNPTTQGHNLNFASAPVFSTSSRVMYIGTGNSLTVTGLTAGTTYTYRVYTYSLGSSSTYRYSTGTSITRLSRLENVILPAAAGTNLAALVSWTNPGAACFDEVMVVANLTPGIQFSPTGDGSAYIPNQTYAGPNSIVYKADANTNAADVLGLTNNTTYYFEIFVRKGTQWSTGVEVSAIPNNATVFGPGDIAIIAINTQYLSSGSDDEVCFFAFKDIEQGTSIDFTDNGYERVSSGLWGDTEGTIRITRTGGGTISAGRVVCLRGQGNSSSDFSIRNCGSADNANWNISSLNGALYSFDLNQNDQIWMFQNGAWSNPPGSHNATYTGNVVWGWTAIGWEPSPGYASTAGSTLYEGTECFNVNLQGIPNNDKVKYTGPMTATSQIVWIQRINTPANWSGYSNNANYNAGGQNYGGSCVTFPFTTVGLTPGVWNGFKNTDWFDCNNWDDLRVPQASVDVTVPNVTNKPVIGSGTGQCRDIQIQASSNLTMNHSASVLEVYGSWFNNSGSNLSLQVNSSATVKMRGGGTRSVGGSTETYFQRLIVENGTHVNLERDTRVGGTGLLRVTGAGSRLGALHSVGSQRALNIQGNTTMELTAGGTMDDNALDHLTILTGGNSSSATISGSGQAIKCWNFEPVKTTSGGVTLSANTPFICKNDFDANLNGTAVFTDNGSTITVGDDIVLAGGGPSNYNFTGTFVLNGVGSGATSTIQDGTDAPKGHLNNLTINPPVGRPDVQFNPQTGSQTTVVKGNLTILSGQTSVYGNTIEVRGNWDNQVGETAFIEGTSTIVFNGSGTQTLSCPGGEYFHDLSRSGSGTLQLATGIHVTRDFGMTSGTLDVMPANHPINVQRNWTHTAGTFTPRTGTVTFYGALNTLINGINMHRLDMQKDPTARTVTTASNLLLTGRLNLQVGRFVMPTHTVTAHDAVIDSPAALLDIEGPSVLNITMP